MTPLRVFKEGSVLTVIASEGDWDRMEWQDPQWRRRVGYIEKQDPRYIDCFSGREGGRHGSQVD